MEILHDPVPPVILKLQNSFSCAILLKPKSVTLSRPDSSCNTFLLKKQMEQLQKGLKRMEDILDEPKT